jgi:uncharacterized protein (TIGR02246 family)
VTRRPALSLGGAAAESAAAAVASLVEDLQRGWDDRDAEITDGQLADDVVWGSPFGATVEGYDELHAIHEHLKQQARGGRDTRFEIVNVLAPAPDVAVAQVRRVALDASGHEIPPTDEVAGAFSEMALYVLVRRDGRWWLAAGQNTIIRPPPDR